MHSLQHKRLFIGQSMATCRLWLLALAAVLAGCTSGRFASYVSPRVTGHVVDQQTLQPLADVRVTRITGGKTRVAPNQLKGAEVMQRPPAVMTDKDGHFAMDSDKVVALFRHAGWYSVTLAFEHAGYETWQTNYTIDDVTGHASDGAPVVNAGEILLHRLQNEKNSRQ